MNASVESQGMNVEEIVRACFRAYETKDRDLLESLLAPDFTFTSPLDDHISRLVYFERCWPNSEHLEKFEIERLFVQGDEAFVQYLAHPANGQWPFRNTECFTLRDGKVSQVEVYFGSETGQKAAEDEVRQVIEAWAEAIRKKDVEGVLWHFPAVPEKAVRYYLAPPLQADMPVRQNLEEWFATWAGDIGYEMRDLKIQTVGDLALAHSLNHLTGTKGNGEPDADVWFRETVGLRKQDGQWRIVHEHESVPFMMDGSFQAAVHLQP